MWSHWDSDSERKQSSHLSKGDDCFLSPDCSIFLVGCSNMFYAMLDIEKSLKPGRLLRLVSLRDTVNQVFQRKVIFYQYTLTTGVCNAIFQECFRFYITIQALLRLFQYLLLLVKLPLQALALSSAQTRLLWFLHHYLL